jgi:hypothetical protein
MPTDDTHPSVRVIQRSHEWPSFTFQEIKVWETSNIIKNLKMPSALGHDGKTAELLNMVAPSLAGPITKLFNVYIMLKEVPLDLKRAIETPQYKKGDRANAGNYRPISNLTIITKCLEKALCHQLTQHFEKFLPEDMFGFRRRRGCELALVNLIEFCRKRIDLGEHVIVISLDLSRAFDCIDHALMVSKLKVPC